MNEALFKWISLEMKATLFAFQEWRMILCFQHVSVVTGNAKKKIFFFLKTKKSNIYGVQEFLKP